MMRMKMFKELLLESKYPTNIEDIEKALGDDFSDFILNLGAYIDYNDKDSADVLFKYLPKLKKAGIITKPKEVYRLVKLERITDYKPEVMNITSTATKRFSPSFLKDMKKTVDQYQKYGEYYCIIIDKCEGLDVNKLYKLFKGKKRYLTKKYDKPGNMVMDVMYDSFEDKKFQNEFIVFGNYNIKDIIKV
jgi:hypothetical protein